MCTHDCMGLSNDCPPYDRPPLIATYLDLSLNAFHEKPTLAGGLALKLIYVGPG